HELRTAHSRLRRGIAAELPRPGAVFSPLGEELPLGVEDLNPAVRLVRDVDAAIAADGEAARKIELTVAGAGLAPLPEELSVAIVDADPIGLLFVRRPALGEVAEVEVAVAVDGDPAPVGQHLEHRQQLAVGAELLHAAVVEVRHEDVVLLADGDADGKVE